ncbi:MAG: hypothetical protein ACRDEA_02020, partial [Microcystaceae cyanobacterium]
MSHVMAELEDHYMDLSPYGLALHYKYAEDFVPRKIVETITYDLDLVQAMELKSLWTLLSRIGFRFRLDLHHDHLEWLFSDSEDAMMCTAIVPILLPKFREYGQLY